MALCTMRSRDTTRAARVSAKTKQRRQQQATTTHTTKQNLLLGARGAVTWRNRYGREETAISASTANPPARTSRAGDAAARERRAFLSREWKTPRRRRADHG